MSHYETKKIKTKTKKKNIKIKITGDWPYFLKQDEYICNWYEKGVKNGDSLLFFYEGITFTQSFFFPCNCL